MTRNSTVYRSAIIGCGPRAHEHARAYDGLSNLSIVAVCDLDDTRRTAFASDYGIPANYRDLKDMLGRERPDIVHIVTQPDVRIEPIEAAARAGVKLTIVEKPVTLWPSEMAKLSSIERETGMRIVVNHQRRYFPQYLRLRDVIRSGQLGAIQFIRASAHGPVLAMGPHLMDLVLYFLDDTLPTSAWATAEGREGYDWSHAAPNHFLANYVFPGNRHVWFECSPRSLGTPDVTEYWMHLHLDFWCERGRAWVAQVGTWGYQAEGMVDSVGGSSNWYDDHLPGQRAFTQAVAVWLDDPGSPHECRLTNAERGFAALTGGLYSSLVRHHVDFPAPVSDADLRALRDSLTR